MDLTEKERAWARRFTLLAQRTVRLQRLERELVTIIDRLTREEIAEKIAVVKIRFEIATGLVEVLETTTGDGAHHHLLANIERFAEETERAIKLDEQILAHHRTT